MTHLRSTVRGTVRAALATALPDVTWSKDWWTKREATALPIGGVATPRSLDRRISVGSVARVGDIVVFLKRSGGEDLEDILDADSVTIESTVLGVLDGLAQDYHLAETSTNVDASGRKPIGELNMLFQAEFYTAEGDPE